MTRRKCHKWQQRRSCQLSQVGGGVCQECWVSCVKAIRQVVWIRSCEWGIFYWSGYWTWGTRSQDCLVNLHIFPQPPHSVCHEWSVPGLTLSADLLGSIKLIRHSPDDFTPIKGALLSFLLTAQLRCAMIASPFQTSRNVSSKGLAFPYTTILHPFLSRNFLKYFFEW